jgi:hypothetical protein
VNFTGWCPGRASSAGETSKIVIVPVNGDLLNEPDETFFVNLSGASNASLSVAQAEVTIVNDDPVPSICVDDVQVVEGNSGTTEARFTVRLSAPSGQPVSVDYATADGTALSGSDYVAVSGTLVFGPAGGSVPPQAPVLSVERSGTQVMVSWISSWNGFELQVIDLLGGGSDWTTVTNAPVVSGDRYSVTLAAASGSEFYRLAPGQGSSAGETSKIVVVPVNGDLLNEPDEAFLLKLSNAGNGLIGCAQAVGTIVNDDPVPSICVEDVQVVEGNSGTTEARFTVRLSAPSGQPVSVDYATADGTALSGSDYVARAARWCSRRRAGQGRRRRRC